MSIGDANLSANTTKNREWEADALNSLQQWAPLSIYIYIFTFDSVRSNGNSVSFSRCCLNAESIAREFPFGLPRRNPRSLGLNVSRNSLQNERQYSWINMSEYSWSNANANTSHQAAERDASDTCILHRVSRLSISFNASHTTKNESKYVGRCSRWCAWAEGCASNSI